VDRKRPRALRRKRGEMNDQPDSVMKCEEIQGVLFDYMTHELGESRSELVREHLRRCPDCRRTAAEIQETLTLLETDSRQLSLIPESLSDEHRRRVIRSIAHPILDWIYRHHRLVSILTAIVAVTVAIFAIKHVASRIQDPPESGPPVIIRSEDAA
jgi:predicted anti-sigma-YlaC factor YlaD